jgi:rod shape-determining protein MreC
MVAIPSRHRSLALLTGVLLLQVLFLAVQVRRDSRGRLIRVWAVGALSPFERGGAWGFGKVGGVWHHYFALQNTAHQNEALKSENEALKLTIATLQTKADEADRLAAILKFQQSHTGVPTLGARVIGASAGTASLTVEIDRGERDGVKRNMAVITPDGAVGKIIEVYRDNSQVLLLTDRTGGAGAMLVDSRIQSPVNGTGEPLLTMNYVAAEDKVGVGEKVVTSGMDKIFPRGIPVGTVSEVKPGPTPTFKFIRVLPAAKLDRLETVIILLSQQPVEFKSDAVNPPAGAANASGTASDAPAKPAATEKP